jgi:hypothetical protein
MGLRATLPAGFLPFGSVAGGLNSRYERGPQVAAAVDVSSNHPL